MGCSGMGLNTQIPEIYHGKLMSGGAWWVGSEGDGVEVGVGTKLIGELE